MGTSFVSNSFDCPVAESQEWPLSCNDMNNGSALTDIYIAGKNLQNGFLATQLGLLTDLRRITLYANQLRGTVSVKCVDYCEKKPDL